MGQGHSSDPCPSCYYRGHCDPGEGTSRRLQSGIPFIPECELFHEGGPNAFQLDKDCAKNPGHKHFIPVNKLTIDHLPEKYQTTMVMDYLRLQINKTVKINVKYTSFNRPTVYPNSVHLYPYGNLKGSNRVTRWGTGVFILGPVEKTGPCPCHLCRTSGGKPKEKYFLSVISTAAHVIFDDAEARSSTIEMFYDSEENMENVKYLYGIGLFKDSLYDHRDGANNDCDAKVVENENNNVKSNDFKEMEAEAIVKRCHQDRQWIVCASHDLNLLDELMKDDDRKMHQSQLHCKKISLPRKYGVIISHPHGLSKRVSFGHIHHHRYPLSPNKPIEVPYVFSRGVMCRIRENCLCTESSSTQLSSSEINDSLKLLQEFLKLDGLCNRGTEYKLKQKISILPPLDAIYLSESIFQKGCADYWVRFHPGTKFALQDEEEHANSLSYYVLQNVELNFFEADFNFYTGLSYATYDIPTCPGSSGAKVLFTEIKEFHGQHSGALENHNRSALDFY